MGKLKRLWKWARLAWLRFNRFPPGTVDGEYRLTEKGRKFARELRYGTLVFSALALFFATVAVIVGPPVSPFGYVALAVRAPIGLLLLVSGIVLIYLAIYEGDSFERTIEKSERETTERILAIAREAD